MDHQLDRWTLGQVMAAISITGFTALVVLLLFTPAPRTATGARRSQCRNNLHQIGLAMHNYHEAWKCFPPGIIAAGVPEQNYCGFLTDGKSCEHPLYSQATAFTLILPYMEERQAFNQYNMKLASCAVQNTTSISNVVQGYLCPSRSFQEERVLGNYFGTGAGPLDYVLCMGSNSLLTCDSPFDPKSNYPSAFRRGAGVFNLNRSINQKQIVDGLSSTILVGEATSLEGNFIARPLHGFSAETANWQRMTDSSVGLEQAWAQSFVGFDGKPGYGSVFAATAFDQWYDAQGKPAKEGPSPGYTPLRLGATKLRAIRAASISKSFAASMQRGNSDNSDQASAKPTLLDSNLVSMTGFRSLHNNSMQFLMADGSVQTIQEKVELDVLNAMATIAGGEEIPAETK